MDSAGFLPFGMVDKAWMTVQEAVLVEAAKALIFLYYVLKILHLYGVVVVEDADC